MKYIIIAAIAIFLILLGIVFFIKRRSFSPNPDKKQQADQINKDLSLAGFAYDMKNDYFYTLRNCWQRSTGYCRLYDEGSPLFNMVMDCEPITFAYKGKRWLIELWKGQYGIATGAEIGVYNTEKEDIHSEKFTGTFYEAAGDDEQLDMSFVLLKNGHKLLARRAKHWWLTAFKVGEFSKKDSLTMQAKIRFPDKEMCEAFINALTDLGYSKTEFSKRRLTVIIDYTVPHSRQPNSQEGIQEKTVQGINKSNCALYNSVTSEYKYTPDKLEYLKSIMPELYNFMLKSLYGREFFKAFEWLLKLIHGKPSEPDEPCKPIIPSCPEADVQDICRQCRKRCCEQMTADKRKCVHKGRYRL